jgi:hypothetical protein
VSPNSHQGVVRSPLKRKERQERESEKERCPTFSAAEILGCGKFPPVLAALPIEVLDLVYPPVVRLLLLVVSMARFVSFRYAVLMAKTIATPIDFLTPNAPADTPTPARSPIRSIGTQVRIPIRRPHLAYTISLRHPPPPLALPCLYDPLLLLSRRHMRKVGGGDRVDSGEFRGCFRGFGVTCFPPCSLNLMLLLAYHSHR